MADETYTKLFSSITRSSIWLEDDQTLRVWVTMLALANRHGYVGASPGGLAATARVPVEKVREALDKFLSPDPDSRSPEYEGRRIEVADRGWNVLNYDRFRDMRDEEMRRAVDRDRKREQRRNRPTKEPKVPPVSQPVEDISGLVPRNPPSRSRSQASASPDQDLPLLPSVVAPPGGHDRDISQGDLESFSPKPKEAKKRAKAQQWRRFPHDFEPDDSHRELAAELRLNLAEQMTLIRDHEYKTPKSDPAAALRTWLRNAPKFGAPSNAAPVTRFGRPVEVSPNVDFETRQRLAESRRVQEFLQGAR